MQKENKVSTYSQVLHNKFSQIVCAVTDNNSINSSIRIAFKAIGQLFQCHRQSLQFLQKNLPLKASKQQLHQLLSQKVSIVDLSTTLGSINDVLDKKVNIMDFNTMLQQSALSSDVDRKMAKLTAKNNSQLDMVNCVVRDLAEGLQKLEREEQRGKARVEEAVRILTGVVGGANDKVERLEREIEGIKKLKENIDQSTMEIQKLREDVKKQIEQTSHRITTMATSPSTKNIDPQLKQTIIESINNIKQTCQQNQKEIKKFNKGLRKKEFDGIQDVIMKAVDKLRSQLEGIAEEKMRNKPNASDSEIQKIVIKVLKEYSWLTREEFTKEIMQLQLNLNSKPSLQQVKLAFKAFEQDILFSIESVKNQLNKRLDTQALNRNRQPVDLMQRPSLKGRDLGKFLTVDEFRKYQQDQLIIQQNVCYQNIVGRWSWKGAPNSDRIVSWQVEMINTLSDNFIWVAGSHYIKVKNAGLYYIVVGIFSDSVEMQAALYMNETELSQLKNEEKEANEVVARVLSQYVYLKENSRVSVYYQGSKNTEGFISIKRL